MQWTVGESVFEVAFRDRQFHVSETAGDALIEGGEFPSPEAVADYIFNEGE